MITAPLIFIGFGYAIGINSFSITSFDVDHSAIHFIAEITLILVLFTDAARIDLGRIRRDHNSPIRMLTIGMHLMIVFGTLTVTVDLILRATYANELSSATIIAETPV